MKTIAAVHHQDLPPAPFNTDTDRPVVMAMVTTPEARMKHWQRCIRDRPRWPFHVATRCADPRGSKALAEHLQHIHGVDPAYLIGWYPPIDAWEQLLARHQYDHDRNGWDTHSHADVPDVSWP